MPDFVHLHLHTQYSLLDGCCRPADLFTALKQKGQTAVAITDHGVMYGIVEFYKAAKKAGIKLIIGCEVYVAPRSRFLKERQLDSNYNHLVLLCKNEIGYKNLIKLVSAGFTEGFYSKPRIDKELLEKHSEGLIALSACLAGSIPTLLTKGDYEGALKEALWYNNTFGQDNFYIELQDHGLMEQKRILPSLIRLSKETGIPLVATNDVHYIEKQDSKTQEVLIALQTGKKLNEENSLSFETDEFYLKSAEQMAAIFYETPEAISNTVKIAEKCNFEFEFGKIKLPRFDIGERDHTEYLRWLCEKGLIEHYGENPDSAITARLDYEIGVISKMGYVDYYLIVWDFVRFAKENGIPVGPGRGSGAGSLAAYCMGITGIDPIKYNLLFERFLNPERVSMPDFDIDFCYVRRQEVIDYVVSKYGADHVAQIVTFGTMAARNAVRDVGRVMDLPYSLCDRVAKLIPRELHTDLSAALSRVTELKKLYDSDDDVKRLIDMAKKVEGMPRHASTHAAGVVISDLPVNAHVPLSKNDDAVVTQYTMTALDELGLLKMDFLGLRNLTIIDDCQKQIRKNNPEFSVADIAIDDEKTIKMMAKGLTEGVFQFESAGMVNVLRSFSPETLEDLIAILSLYRPGPMDSIPKYIHNRFHKEDIKYDTPLLRPILESTYGCVVYQEQVMQICRALAGYSLGRADIVRRAMSKKKHDVMNAERNAFVYGESDAQGNVIVKGAVPNGVDEKTAHKIFDDLVTFSSYAFNKSHAAAYGYLAYQTAFLKCHYPAEYMASLLTSVMDYSEKVVEYTAECKRLGLSILPPHVNYSEDGIVPDGGKIRFGLLAIKNLGRILVTRIIAERKKAGKYLSFYDFCLRNASRELNRRAVECLIKSGALDGLGANRRQMLFGLDEVLSACDNKIRFENGGQMGLFSDITENGPSEFNLPYVEELSEKELLAYEKEATGLYLSSHPMRRFANYARFIKSTPLRVISDPENDGKRFSTVCLISSLSVKNLKNGNTVVSLGLEDETAFMGGVCFSAVYNKNKHLLLPENVVKLNGKVSVRDDRPPEFLIENAENLPQFALNFKIPVQKAAEYVIIRVNTMSGSIFSSVKELLTLSKGDVPVYVYDMSQNKKFAANGSMAIDAFDGTIEKITEIVGGENIKIKWSDS